MDETSFVAYNGRYIEEVRPVPASCNAIGTKPHVPVAEPDYNDYSVYMPIIGIVGSLGLSFCCMGIRNLNDKISKLTTPAPDEGSGTSEVESEESDESEEEGPQANEPVESVQSQE